MDLNEKQYKVGFNSGYFLAQHEPELSKIIVDTAKSTNDPGDYANGLANGHDTYITEKNITHNKDEKPELPNEKLGDNYQKGFNSGYFLTKYEPEIAEKIFGSMPNHSEYSNGMYEGKNEHEMEKIQERLNEIAKNKQKDDKELDKDK